MARHFRDEHAQMRAMLDAYVAMLEADALPDLAVLLKHRLAISGAVRALLAMETTLFDVLRTGDPAHPVDKLLDEHGAFVRETMPGYNSLIREWTPARIAEDWPNYCRAARAQIDAYRDFLKWEIVHILPLVENGPAPFVARPAA